ncbi:RHS repeat-associated core domain-containing protein [Pseudomonas sp. Tri1]|uniref:RHS repeat-associated core domain-containing protein n=1 Tax=Pseudomonas sp. Tri1 TaxID=2823875 RepID=UPI001B31D46A|nr:RHS repeat-associated core domain-containing protein [Pseudomonas sp. Tri1]
MSTNRTTLLCRYHYDPLDCLADYTPSTEVRTQRFYLKERLASEIQGPVQRSVFQQDDQLLAQQQRQDDAVETTLLATDKQRSVLHALDATQLHPLVYTPYGHRLPASGLLSLLGFNGERSDPVTGHYLLGNGYRAFNPTLMRFNSPDSMSPFGKGGLNAYVYGQGDPINTIDPTGHFIFPNPIKGLMNLTGLKTPKTTLYVQNIKLRILPSDEEMDFFEAPTIQFIPKLRLSPEQQNPRIQNLENRLIENSAILIGHERQAALEIKAGRRTESKFDVLLETIYSDRSSHNENLRTYEKLLREVPRPPHHDATSDNPLPNRASPSIGKQIRRQV